MSGRMSCLPGCVSDDVALSGSVEGGHYFVDECFGRVDVPEGNGELVDTELHQRLQHRDRVRLLQQLQCCKDRGAFDHVGGGLHPRLAELLLEDLDQPSRIVSVESEHRIDAFEVARTLSELSGRQVDPVAVPREAWESTLLYAGLSAAHVALIVELYDAHNAGLIDVETGVTEQRFGPTSLVEVFREMLSRISADRAGRLRRN